MTNYRAVRIGHIGDVVTGKTPPTNDKNNYGSDYMFLGPTDLHKHFIIDKSEKMISKKGLNTIKGSILDNLSILVGCIGWDMGNVALVHGKCATNQQINSITNIKSDFNPYYIYYWLKNKKEYLFQLANVTRTPILNKTDFSNIEIGIPDKIHQDKIVKILTSIDSKIELNNHINAKLEAISKTLYDYWFVQFDFPNPEGKPYKSSGGKLVWSEELKREIPEGWKVRNLFIEMDVQYGFPFSTEKFTDKVTEKPVIRIRDILENTISTYSTEDVDDKYMLQQNDLLIGMDGNFHLNFWDKNGAYLNQRSVRIRSRINSKVSNFQAYFELSPYIKAREKNVSRTTVGHLSDQDLKGLFIISPDKNKIFNPKSTFDTLLKKLISNRIQNQQLSSLRDWLLPILMNGQVKVGDEEEVVN